MRQPFPLQETASASRCIATVVLLLTVCFSMHTAAWGAEFKASFETDPFASTDHGWIKSSPDEQAKCH